MEQTLSIFSRVTKERTDATHEIPAFVHAAAVAGHIVGSGHAPSLTNGWAAAATNIQAAVDLCAAGDTVLVASGQYVVTAPIMINRAITLQALWGAAATELRGAFPASTNRCLDVDGMAAVDGFTLVNGYVTNASGGGAACYANDWQTA